MSELQEWIREPDYSEDFSLEEMINWIDRRPLAEVATLDAALAEAVREREDYNGKHQAAVIEIERLRAAVLRIDAINDSPARFSQEINEVCDTILRPHLSPPTDREER
jgi:hypothetical protein